MGNASSAQSFFGSGSNSIWVQAERNFYHAGDTVRGVVCLNCVNAVQTTGIELKVTGLEKTEFTETRTRQVHRADGSTASESYSEHHYGNKCFFKVKVLLGPASLLPPGQYQFGFAFALPINLPSTFAFAYGDVRGRVVYKVKACCHTPGVFKPAIKCTQQLTVYQRHSIQPRAIVSSAEADVKLWCCFGRGHASAEICVDKDAYCGGEQAQIQLQCDNQSSEAFNSIEVTLKRRITLHASFGSKTVSQDVVRQTYAGVARYTTLQGSLARFVPLSLPSGLPPTTHGQLISCDYWVAAKLKGGCCVTDLKMKVPAIIYPPQPLLPVFQQPPPEWMPTKVFDPVPVEIPSAPPLPPDALSPESDFWLKAMGAAGSGDNQGQHEGRQALEKESLI